ncbi:nurim homolog [Prorops nasuta]|uniref:nurim homolog n=1 Tax=Prorops nasuta TaxID=863751 RepID=UPI0034CE97D9
MLSNIFNISLCIIAFLYTPYVLKELMQFLSDYKEHIKTSDYSESKESLVTDTLWNLIYNMLFLSAFLAQHSIMASSKVKAIWYKLHIGDAERCIYNIASAAFLHILCKQWQPIPWFVLWDINTAKSTQLWLLFTLFQTLGWTIVYGGCLMMDVGELAGLKQIYYKLSNRPCPMTLKSDDLRRYYEHMRHPSFIGFLMVLWIHPFMTIDRCLIGLVLTFYMSIMWNIDDRDYYYHEFVIKRKLVEY